MDKLANIESPQSLPKLGHAELMASLVRESEILVSARSHIRHGEGSSGLVDVIYASLDHIDPLLAQLSEEMLVTQALKKAA